MSELNPPTPQPIDLLIVDDDVDLRELLHFYFSNLGYRVEIAANGRDAIQFCAQLKPRLILLDINLPGPDGHEVYEAIRKMPDTDNTSIIFLTQHNTRDDRLAGLGLGADDFIGKPFDIQELRLRVQRRLGK
jgi:DNA-binding response OmpR family regulator